MNREQSAQEKLEICRAYRSLFLNEGGDLKSEAEAILRDLEKETGWMVNALPINRDGDVDPYRAVANLEKRRIYAHIKKRLYEPLGGVKRVMENNND